MRQGLKNKFHSSCCGFPGEKPAAYNRYPADGFYFGVKNQPKVFAPENSKKSGYFRSKGTDYNVHFCITKNTEMHTVMGKSGGAVC